MLKVGLTGPAGSGKSTVAKRLAETGWPVVDADRVAHELYVPGGEIVHRLAEAFGPGILGRDGGIDRSALGRIVFASPEARERLNALVHPRLIGELTRRLDLLERNGAPIAVLDAALLLQWDARGLVDVVVGVWAPRDVRLRRLVASGLPPDIAENRVDAQMSETTLRGRADILIENTESPADLERRVVRLIDELKRRAASA